MEHEFNPESGAWVTVEQMRRLCRLRDTNSINKWRDKLDHRFEHTEPKGAHRGVWLLALDWIAAYTAAGRKSPAAETPNKVDHGERLQRVKADREELRYLKDLEVLLHVRDATRDVDMFGSAVRKGIEQLPPACQEIMLAAIDEAENEWIRRHGDGIERADAQIEGPASGVVEADDVGAAKTPAKPPRVRRKVHHHAGKRTKGRPKVQG